MREEDWRRIDQGLGLYAVPVAADETRDRLAIHRTELKKHVQGLMALIGADVQRTPLPADVLDRMTRAVMTVVQMQMHDMDSYDVNRLRERIRSSLDVELNRRA